MIYYLRGIILWDQEVDAMKDEVVRSVESLDFEWNRGIRLIDVRITTMSWGEIAGCSP
jgi:hypothetical protein